jgi:uncharacterized membrane protein YgcG
MLNPYLGEQDDFSSPASPSQEPAPAGTFVTFLTAIASAAAAFLLLLISGCASSVDGQWSDPQLGPGALRGARILVACEADEAVVQRLCADQLASAVAARGGIALRVPDNLANAPANPPVGDPPYLAAAREQNARALLTSRVTPAPTETSGSGFSFGIGGFGFGGGGVSTGVGLSVPVGGQQVSTNYAANTRLVDPAAGKLLWTAKASNPPSRSNDIKGQIDELTRTTFAAIDKAGLF